jgi:hypothetical protein
MFSINIYLRLALIVVLFALGIGLSVAFGFWYGFPFSLIALFLLVGYLLLGTVQSAAMLMQTNDTTAAEKRLNLTLTPKLLYSANRAYYYLLKAGIAQVNGNNVEAEELLHKAQQIELPSDNEKAMVELQLANIAAQKNRWPQVQIHLKNAKQLKVTEPTIKEQLKQFEKAMGNRSMLKPGMATGKQGAQMMQPGGKRRRPKMR